MILNRIDIKLDNYLSTLQMAFRKKKSTQKCLVLRKHMLTVEKYYNKDIKIIEHESDVDSAYLSRIQICNNNCLMNILGCKNKFVDLIMNFYKES